jgi:hypothetical protein
MKSWDRSPSDRFIPLVNFILEDSPAAETSSKTAGSFYMINPIVLELFPILNQKPNLLEDVMHLQCDNCGHELRTHLGFRCLKCLKMPSIPEDIVFPPDGLGFQNKSSRWQFVRAILLDDYSKTHQP